MATHLLIIISSFIPEYYPKGEQKAGEAGQFASLYKIATSNLNISAIFYSQSN